MRKVLYPVTIKVSLHIENSLYSKVYDVTTHEVRQFVVNSPYFSILESLVKLRLHG